MFQEFRKLYFFKALFVLKLSDNVVIYIIDIIASL